MIEAIIKGVTDMIKPILKENECYGLFYETPKLKKVSLISCYKDKDLTNKQLDYVIKLNHKRYKGKFYIHKMTYIFNPEDYLLLEEVVV